MWWKLLRYSVMGITWENRAGWKHRLVKMLRDPGSSVKDGVVIGTQYIFDLEEDSPLLESHILCWFLF